MNLHLPNVFTTARLLQSNSLAHGETQGEFERRVGQVLLLALRVHFGEIVDPPSNWLMAQHYLFIDLKDALGIKG